MSSPRDTVGRAPLLHNMSAPPKTTVVCDQGSVNGRAVLFSIHELLQRAGQRLPLRVKCRIRECGLEGLTSDELSAALTHIDPELPADVLRGDHEPPLRGVLVGWASSCGYGPGLNETGIDGALAFKNLSYCTDVSLTLRILSRCESLLYLGHRSPMADLRQLADRPLILDDPRLAALPDLAPPPACPWPQSKKDAEVEEELRRARHPGRYAARRETRKAARRKRTPRSPGPDPTTQGASP